MSDRTVAAIFAVALAALVLFPLHAWLGFGIAACALLVLGLVLGFARLHPALLLVFAAYVALLAGMVWLADSSRLILGLPAATALLVYGIWPMPLLAALLYGLLFRSSVLPDDKLEKFLAEHGRRRPAE
jgi:hypothetical protein